MPSQALGRRHGVLGGSLAVRGALLLCMGWRVVRGGSRPMVAPAADRRAREEHPRRRAVAVVRLPRHGVAVGSQHVAPGGQAHDPMQSVGELVPGHLRLPFGIVRERRGVHEALRGGLPGERVALHRAHGLRLRLERRLQLRGKLARRAEEARVGEGLEEGVGRVVGDDDDLAHGQRLRRGRAEHLRGARVDKDVVPKDRLVGVVCGVLEGEGKPLGGGLGADLRRVRARADARDGDALEAAEAARLGEEVDELPIAFGPERLGKEVGAAALRARRRGRGPARADGEEVRPHAVHVDHHAPPGEPLERVGELDDHVAVGGDTEAIDEPRARLRGPSEGARVGHVVGVRDAHHVRKVGVPPVAVVDPVEVLGLLKDANVPTFGRQLADEVRGGHDAPGHFGPCRRVPCDAKVHGGQGGLLHGPEADVGLLLRGRVEAQARREDKLLVLAPEPGHHQGDAPAALPGAHVGRAEERIDGGARHPRDGRGGHDGDVPPLGAHVRGRQHFDRPYDPRGTPEGAPGHRREGHGLAPLGAQLVRRRRRARGRLGPAEHALHELAELRVGLVVRLRGLELAPGEGLTPLILERLEALLDLALYLEDVRADLRRRGDHRALPRLDGLACCRDALAEACLSLLGRDGEGALERRRVGRAPLLLGLRDHIPQQVLVLGRHGVQEEVLNSPPPLALHHPERGLELAARALRGHGLGRRGPPRPGGAVHEAVHLLLEALPLRLEGPEALRGPPEEVGAAGAQVAVLLPLRHGLLQVGGDAPDDRARGLGRGAGPGARPGDPGLAPPSRLLSIGRAPGPDGRW
mmetsp:Transcript_10054/g.34165  ORF Transcript_10054/g.34165 Transcript_10054/m.34165 type:complete len:809 (+) Transcript_10054:859-3285(+)